MDAQVQTLYARAEEVRSASGGVTWSRPKQAFNIWKEWKRPFRDAQHDRCAFCQGDTSRQYGDVEHYAPKAEVRASGGPRNEVDKCVQSPPMPAIPGAERGFWWRAYDWDNRLYACELCNRDWKKNLFPVAESPYPTLVHGTAVTPLLLNPFNDPDPEEHLLFNSSGQVYPAPGSVRGRATIDTCGLDSGTLQQERGLLAARVYRRCQGIVGEAPSNVLSCDAIRSHAHELQWDAAPQTAWSGMVRSLVRQQLGVTWEQIALASFTDNVDGLRLLLADEPIEALDDALQLLALDASWLGLADRLRRRTTTGTIAPVR